MFRQSRNLLRGFLTTASTRGKEKLEQLPCEQFLQAFKIYRALLRSKKMGEKYGKIQNPVKIAHQAVVLIFLSL